MINVKYIEPKKLACPQEIVVTFRYKQEIVNVIRTIPDRFWDAKNKEWHLSYDSLPVLKEALPNEEFNVIGTPIDNKKYGEKIIEKHFDLPKGLKTQLYPFQEEGFNEMMNFDKFLLLWEMGLGKTACAITVALKRKELNKIKHCLIVCGVNSIKYNWQDEIKIHTGMDSMVLGNRQNKKGKWEVKSNKDKLDDLKNLNEFFIITNIETLRDKTITEELKKLVQNGTIEMIVCDEIDHVKTPQAQQSKGFINVSKYAKYVYGLTGTLLSNSPLDAYVPLKVVDGEKANYTNFKYRYCIYGGFGGYNIVGYKHLDELQKKLNMVSLRRTKEETLDLPDKVYQVDYVELGTKQRKLYNDVLKTIMEDIDNIMLSPNPLSQLTRLRQATADTSILSSSVNESAKFERLDYLLQEITSRGQKAIVFSNWTTVADRLVARYKEYNPAVITGAIKDRKSQQDKFMENDDCKILIATISAAGTGLTLTSATFAIFVDEPYTNAAYEQAADRIYRIGQKNKVTIISLIAKDTIDERVHKIMMKKKHISEAIVDKQYNLKDKKVLEWLLDG